MKTTVANFCSPTYVAQGQNNMKLAEVSPKAVLHVGASPQLRITEPLPPTKVVIEATTFWQNNKILFNSDDLAAALHAKASRIGSMPQIAQAPDRSIQGKRIKNSASKTAQNLHHLVSANEGKGAFATHNRQCNGSAPTDNLFKAEINDPRIMVAISDFHQDDQEHDSRRRVRLDDEFPIDLPHFKSDILEVVKAYDWKILAARTKRRSYANARWHSPKHISVHSSTTRTTT